MTQGCSGTDVKHYTTMDYRYLDQAVIDHPPLSSMSLACPTLYPPLTLKDKRYSYWVDGWIITVITRLLLQQMTNFVIIMLGMLIRAMEGSYIRIYFASKLIKACRHEQIHFVSNIIP